MSNFKMCNTTVSCTYHFNWCVKICNNVNVNVLHEKRIHAHLYMYMNTLYLYLLTGHDDVLKFLAKRKMKLHRTYNPRLVKTLQMN